MANDIKQLVLIGTAIFLLAPAFLIGYILINNRRRRKDLNETKRIKAAFESELLKAKMEIQEQTLQTIGFDLHDNIGQLLSLTNLTLKSISIVNQETAKRKIETVIDLTSQSIKELRQLGKLLQGEQLLAEGLQKAIEHQLAWLNKSERYVITFSNKYSGSLAINSNKELIIFRLFQEIVNNIIKHAEASKIEVSLDAQDDDIILCVKDNGKGFDKEQTVLEAPGMGLFSINKRTQMVGGNIIIQTNPGQGTLIELRIPKIH